MLSRSPSQPIGGGIKSGLGSTEIHIKLRSPAASKAKNSEDTRPSPRQKNAKRYPLQGKRLASQQIEGTHHVTSIEAIIDYSMQFGLCRNDCWDLAVWFKRHA